MSFYEADILILLLVSHFWILCTSRRLYPNSSAYSTVSIRIENFRYIGKSIIYFNTVLFLISLFIIWIIQIFISYLFHDLIGTYDFDFIIFNFSYFNFLNRIPQYQLILQKYSVLTYYYRFPNKVERRSPKYRLVKTVGLQQRRR